MKQYMKSVMTMAAMLLFTLGAWADPTVTIIKQLNGTVTTSSGDVTYAFDNDVCVLVNKSEYFWHNPFVLLFIRHKDRNYF